MFKCPNCGKATVTIWDRAKLTVMGKISCKECNGDITVARSVPLLNAMFLFVLVLPDYATNYIRVIKFTNIYVWIGIFLLFLAVNLYVIPLIKKEK